MASVMGQVGKDRGDHRLTFEGAGYILGCTCMLWKFVGTRKDNTKLNSCCPIAVTQSFREAIANMPAQKTIR